MLRKWILFAILGIILSLALSGCGTSTPKTVKIAVVAPLEYGFGQAVHNSVQLALKEAGHKTGDIPVELVFFNTSDPEFNPGDNAFSVEVELKAAQLAIDDPDIVAYVGPIASDQAKASMVIMNKAGLAQISPSTSWPGLTLPGYGPGEPGIYYPTGQRHFFRMSPTDDIQGVVAARWVKELGLEKVYTVHDQSVYSRGLAGIFEVTAQDIGLIVVGSGNYDGDDSERKPEVFEKIATDVATSGAELLYFSGRSDESAEASELINAVIKASPNIQVMTGDALANELPPEKFEGVIASNIGIAAFNLKGQTATTFEANYEKAYGDSLQSSTGTAAYEAIGVILQAIEQAEEPTREGVLTKLRGFEYTGVFGTWHFDKNGDMTPAAVSGWKIEDGEWVFVKVLN